MRNRMKKRVVTKVNYTPKGKSNIQVSGEGSRLVKEQVKNTAWEDIQAETALLVS